MTLYPTSGIAILDSCNDEMEIAYFSDIKTLAYRSCLLL